MSFLFKNHAISPPPGSIIQYFGTDDPDGWIICDGTTRTSTDNRYEQLSTHLNAMLGVSINNPNSCTPPDLREKILYGKSSANIGSTGGSATKTISVDNLPSHTHALTESGHNHGSSSGSHSHTFYGNAHNHGITDNGHDHGTGDNYNIYVGNGNVVTVVQRTDGFYDGGNAKDPNTLRTAGAYTGISINGETATGSISSENVTVTTNNAYSNIIPGYTGGGAALDIMPPYFVINHIMKY